MIIPELIIDSIQESKKAFVNQVFKDSELNKAAHDFIDAQTNFAKALVRTTYTFTKSLADSSKSAKY